MSAAKVTSGTGLPPGVKIRNRFSIDEALADKEEVFVFEDSDGDIVITPDETDTYEGLVFKKTRIPALIFALQRLVTE